MSHLSPTTRNLLLPTPWNSSFPSDLAVKNLPAIQEMWVQSLGGEDPLEDAMATHSSILAWRIPWAEEPGAYSPQGHKESDTTKHTHTRLEISQGRKNC